MSKPISKLELIAYADGELSASRAADIEVILARNPDLQAEVDSLRMLRSQATRTLDDAPRNPMLRRRVEAMFDEAAASEQSAAPLKMIATDQRWWASPKLVLAAAVLLALGALFWVILTERDTKQTAGTGGSELLIELRDGKPPPGIEASMILVAVRKHVTCEQMSDHFYDSRFPRVVAEMPAAAASFLGTDPALPDLSTLGYRFAGAGGCRITGGKTVHALYRSEAPSKEGISIFVQPFDGQVGFAAGHVLVVAGPTSKHHMLAWRTEKLVYFLIGDEVAATRRTAEQMGQRL